MRNSNRQSSRGYRDDRNEYGIESDYRNENYNYNGNDRERGYDNRDYDQNNFWTLRTRDEDYQQRRDDDYAPAVDYGSRGNYERSQRTTGYGNENSRSMNEFEHWRDESRQARYNRREGDNTGYAGRSADDYRNGYGDGHYYRTSDYDRGGRRRNEESDNYNQYAGSDGRAAQHSGGQNERANYNYYESYPSYGQGAPYNDHEYGYIDKQEARGRRGVDNEDDYRSGGNYSRGSSDRYGRRSRPLSRRRRY
jgi:hypothetical protein